MADTYLPVQKYGFGPRSQTFEKPNIRINAIPPCRQRKLLKGLGPVDNANFWRASVDSYTPPYYFVFVSYARAAWSAGAAGVVLL